jgi:hypothetical protein
MRDAMSLLPLLDEALDHADWNHRQADVVLSQHFVRHVVTPPPGKPLSRREEQALVDATLREIYGEEAARWRVEVLSQPPHAGLVGAAVDAAFADELDAVLARHGIGGVTIRPLISVAAHLLPRAFQGWCAVIEPGWLSLIGGANGIWQHLSGNPVGTDWATALPDLIAQEAGVFYSDAPPAVWVQAVGTGAMDFGAAGPGRWQVLPHDAQTIGALALAGLAS